jgi:hypothetical protein
MSPKAALDPSKDRPSIYKSLIFLAAAALMSETPFALPQDQTRTRPLRPRLAKGSGLQSRATLP